MKLDITELEALADDWDIYKYKGKYNVSVLVGKDWSCFRNIKTAQEAITQAVCFLKGGELNET